MKQSESVQSFGLNRARVVEPVGGHPRPSVGVAARVAAPASLDGDSWTVPAVCFQAEHIPSSHGSCECYVLSSVATVSRWSLLLPSPWLSGTYVTYPRRARLCALEGGEEEMIGFVTTIQMGDLPTCLAVGGTVGWVVTAIVGIQGTQGGSTRNRAQRPHTRVRRCMVRMLMLFGVCVRDIYPATST